MAFSRPRISSLLAYTLVMLSAFANIADVAADSSMINNVVLFPGYYTYLGLKSSTTGLNAAIVSVGFILGGPFVGPLLDKVGRVRGMAIGSTLAVVGVLIAGLSTVEAGFAVGRFIFGLYAVVNSTAAPMWLMELAPPKIRITMMGILVGLSAFSCAVYGAVDLGLSVYTSNWAWKGYIMGELIMPLIGLITLPFVPESPRWLVFKGRTEEALEILASFHGHKNPNNDLVQLEYQEICEAIEAEKQCEGSWKSLISPKPNLHRFAIATLTAIFLQLIGAFNLLYFMSSLLVTLGITDTKTIIIINVCLSLWNMIAMLIGGAFIDRFGRKSTLVYATVIISLGLIVSGILQKYVGTSSSMAIGATVVIFIVEFVACASWQVLGYSYPNEVLKFSQRAKGIAISQSIGYCFSFIGLYCFPIALDTITWRYFIINGCWNFVFVVAMWYVFVETQGKTLEEIDIIFEGAVITPGTTLTMKESSLNGDESDTAGPHDSDVKTIKAQIIEKSE